MEDYKEEIRNLLLAHYKVSGAEHKEILRSTTSILNEVRGVIPAKPIDEHDVYDLMKELGFTQKLHIEKEKIRINEDDEDAPPNTII